MLRATSLISIIVLTACTNGPTYEQRQAAYEAQRAYIKSTCSSYGYKEGTTEYSDCLFRADSQLRAQEAQENAQKRALLMQYYSNQQRNPTPQYNYQMPIPKSTQTRCFHDPVSNSSICNSSTR